MRNNRKKLRKFIEKERVLWYLRRGGVYFEDVNGEKEMSIVFKSYSDTLVTSEEEIDSWINSL